MNRVITLDELLDRGMVVTHGALRVIYSAAIAAQLKHIVVVLPDNAQQLCFFCNMPTDWRSVKQNKAGSVVSVDVICELCIRQLERCPHADLTACAAKRRNVALSTLRRDVQRAAEAREKSWELAIAAVCEQLPERPPDAAPLATWAAGEKV